MAEDDKNKVTSLPPPATDEIDEDWGSSGQAASRPKQDKPTAKTPPGKAKSASHDDDDDEDDLDDDDDDDLEEDEDEDDEDEDDDRHATSRQAGKRDAGGAQDWLPEWSPWAVLGVLLVFGLLGGTGIIPIDFSLKKGEPTATAAMTAAPTTTTRPVQAAGSAVRQPLPTQEPGGDAEKVGAAHLLVQYKGSARAAPTITRTKEEALKRAKEALAKARKGVPFEKLVAEYSDEPNAAARGGKLGKFPRQAMVKPFADAAFALKPGQISDIVETQFGYHVIQRTE
jgi:parvulin-like peptidyl-prolyl isomerase